MNSKTQKALVPDALIRCPLCGWVGSSVPALYTHLQKPARVRGHGMDFWNRQLKRIQCPCGALFRSYSQLLEHLYAHHKNGTLAQVLQLHDMANGYERS